MHVLSGAAALGALWAVGCGYSDHDEYFRIRSIVVQATPGDGSMIASIDARGDTKPAMVLNQPRGWASDQPVVRE